MVVENPKHSSDVQKTFFEHNLNRNINLGDISKNNFLHFGIFIILNFGITHIFDRLGSHAGLILNLRPFKAWALLSNLADLNYYGSRCRI